jgi:hypothetical protein
MAVTKERLFVVDRNFSSRRNETEKPTLRAVVDAAFVKVADAHRQETGEGLLWYETLPSEAAAGGGIRVEIGKDELRRAISIIPSPEDPKKFDVSVSVDDGRPGQLPARGLEVVVGQMSHPLHSPVSLEGALKRGYHEVRIIEPQQLKPLTPRS